MTERNRPGPPSFDIPDLELEPAVSKRPAQVSSARAPAAKPPAPAVSEISLGDDGDDGDNDFELIQTGSNVDLSIGTSPQVAKQHVDSSNWPSGRTRAADQLPIDPAEVALVAGYGPAPKNAVLTPVYAYRVYSRRAPLKKAIVELHAELNQAELLRDTELMQLATLLRPTLESSEVFRRLLEPIREIERLAGDRSAALSEADTGYKAQLARFDTELAQLRDGERAAQAACAEKALLKDASEKELRRAEAKHQRVQIEIRGVVDLARQALGPAGGDMSPEHAAKLADLQARGQALEPELTRARSAHGDTSAALDRADAEARRLQTQIRQLERQKATALGSLEQQLSARAAGVSEAEKQRRDALAEVARAVLASRGSVAVPQPTLDAIRQHDKRVEAAALRLETNLRALDSHDRERVKLGVILVLSAAALVLVSILLKAML
ncbi:MAG TPA: hypothetical protein VNG33_01905 [Polyangiaceae bacterium]|nr:hypothetical protein [Polyangiaceae bacterium]